jgi:hypothetical protein
LTITTTGRDIEKNQFIGAFGVIASSQLNRIPSIAKVLKVDALNDSARINIKARDDTNRN